MYTVVETPEFRKQSARVWSDEGRKDFIDWIAANPDADEVIPGARFAGLHPAVANVVGRG